MKWLFFSDLQVFVLDAYFYSHRKLHMHLVFYCYPVRYVWIMQPTLTMISSSRHGINRVYLVSKEIRTRDFFFSWDQIWKNNSPRFYTTNPSFTGTIRSEITLLTFRKDSIFTCIDVISNSMEHIEIVSLSTLNQSIMTIRMGKCTLYPPSAQVLISCPSPTFSTTPSVILTGVCTRLKSIFSYLHWNEIHLLVDVQFSSFDGSVISEMLSSSIHDTSFSFSLLLEGTIIVCVSVVL